MLLGGVILDNVFKAFIHCHWSLSVKLLSERSIALTRAFMVVFYSNFLMRLQVHYGKVSIRIHGHFASVGQESLKCVGFTFAMENFGPERDIFSVKRNLLAVI